MTKADLVDQIVAAIGDDVSKKQCAEVVDQFLQAVKNALAENKHIEIRGFGTLKVRKRQARTARNPRTGEAVPLAARAVPTFKPSRELRAAVEAKPVRE